MSLALAYCGACYFNVGHGVALMLQGWGAVSPRVRNPEQQAAMPHHAAPLCIATHDDVSCKPG